MANNSLPLTCVFIADAKGRGYTGYFAEFPDIIAQGQTKEETEENLMSSLRDILKFNKEKEDYINNLSAKETRHLNLVIA